MSKFAAVSVLSALMCAAIGGPFFAQESQNEPEPRSSSDDGDNTARQQADRPTPLGAIRAASAEFVRAFNAADAKRVAAHWTEDGDYVSETGQTFAGRAEIEKEYARFFEEHPGTRLGIVIDSLRLHGDNAAVEDGRTFLEPAPAGAPATGKYTAMHVKVDGKWLMSAVRDSRLETATAYGNVSDLEFLIGAWTAEEHGVKVESVCRWFANKSFVQRTYTVTHPDQTTASGLQIIGFNPEGGHIQSWNFSSEGGHAIGVWSPRDGGWTAEMRGVNGDGAPTTAVIVLTRLDDNAYSWQSVQRTVNGTALPDTDEVVVKRRPASG